MIRAFRPEFILDADWIIQAYRGYNRAAGVLNSLAPQRIAVSWVTMAEVYEGARGSSNPQAWLERYREFVFPYAKLTVNEEIAEKFSEVRADLRRRGRMISDGDTFIAATALHLDLTVLTFNVRHFSHIPDLKLFLPN